MDNPNYNSLTENLIQNGIIQGEISDSNDSLNIFGIEPDEDMNNSPFIEKPIESSQENIFKKRLDCYDLEITQNSDNDIFSNNQDTFKIISRFLNIKQNLASKGALGTIENFLFAFFPKLYKAKLAKDAMTKLAELNIDTQKLLDKRIPYGEAETRYQNLIKYLSFANEIQTKIKKRTLK